MEMPKEKPEINYPISEPCKDCESVFLPEQGQGSGPGLYKSKCKKGESKEGTMFATGIDLYSIAVSVFVKRKVETFFGFIQGVPM